MALTSPRGKLRGFRQVPLEFTDPDVLMIAHALIQVQERLRMHPVEVVSITADYTALDQDLTVLADATSGVITVTLPSAKGREGRRIIVKKTDASGNAVTLDGNEAETIDGSLTATLASQYSAKEMVSDGTNWHLVSVV